MHDISTFLRKIVKITGVSIPMATSVASNSTHVFKQKVISTFVINPSDA